MDFKSFFDQFNGKRILVVGDVMIDSYLRGKVNRVSPEAPVPIVSLEKEEDRLGGAANVAVNLVALGAKPIICSVIGKDAQSGVFYELLSASGIETDGLIRSSERITTVKTRVIGNNQQLLRIDSEQVHSISKKEEDALLDKIQYLIHGGVDGVIFEDYNKGILTPRVISEIIAFANAKNIVTVVDPKKDNFLAYKNVTLFKPNLKELKEGLGLHFSFLQEKDAFEKGVALLEESLQNKISFITLSEHGVFIKKENDAHYIPAHFRTISDVSGAGDTVVSVATLCLVVGLPIPLIAEISNIAGGLVCEKSGVVSIDKNQLLVETIKLLSK
jgi:rfaE bifunctional protein kinase chain/domain